MAADKPFSLLVVSFAALLALAGCGGGIGTASTDSTPPVTGTNPPPAEPPPPTGPPPPLALASFVTGLSFPVGFEAPADGTNRILILEQGGTIRIVQNGAVLGGTFLGISAKVESGGEEGLLGLAFHPNFATNGKFYVNYTRRAAGQLQTVIGEYQTTSPGSNQASAASERQLLVVNQPFDNHNGGQLAFGPDDGYLYIALGDGGAVGDPFGNGQNTNALLGKILRIGVDPPFAANKQYAIPSDNPFAVSGGAPEVWAYGLRNPWRFSFDPPSHRLFAGDVGQDNWEEVDLISKGGNFGWNIMEGNHCYPPGNTTCTPSSFIAPINEYDHSSTGGSSIIGGFVYRGSAIPALLGAYVFGDLSSGRVWALQQDTSGAWQRTLLLTHNRTVSSFGRAADGELYLVDYVNGAVLHLVAAP